MPPWSNAWPEMPSDVPSGVSIEAATVKWENRCSGPSSVAAVTSPARKRRSSRRARTTTAPIGYTSAVTRTPGRTTRRSAAATAAGAGRAAVAVAGTCPGAADSSSVT